MPELRVAVPDRVAIFAQLDRAEPVMSRRVATAMNTNVCNPSLLQAHKGENPMRAKTLIRILGIASWIGAVLVAVGFYIALFTDGTTKYGLTAMRDDVELIALVMLLLIPAKTVLTFKLMKVEPGESSGSKG
jgi:hypothetical protein